MKDYRKLNSFIALILLSFMSLFIVSTEVNAEEASIPTNVSLYQTVAEVPLQNGELLEATLKKGSYVYLEQTENQGLYIQFGLEKVKVDADFFQRAEDSETKPAYQSSMLENNLFQAYQQLDLGIDPNSSEAVIEFTKEGQYPILSETESGFDALIGNRIISISINKVELDEKPEEGQSSAVPSVDDTATPTTPTTPTTPAPTVPNVSSLTKTVSTSNQAAANPFIGTEKYLKASKAVGVYVKADVKSQKAAVLTPGQEYVIVSHAEGWLKIKFGSTFGYIRSTEVVPGDGKSIKNLNQGKRNSNRIFKTYRSIPIYDSTSGKLVEFGKLETGIDYTIIRQSSPDWLEIDFGGRIGYVYVPHLQLVVMENDNYVMATQADTQVFINKAGASKFVGTLSLDQQYPILDVIPGFVRIKYGNGFGYVRTGTLSASKGYSIQNKNSQYTNSGKVFNTYRTLTVYDNTSGSLVEFAKLNEGQVYPFVKQTSNDWLMVDFAGRVGYVFMPHLILPVSKSDKYFKTVYGKTPIVINQNGKNVKVADLQQGQEFPIISQIPDFVKVQYGDSFAYMRTSYLSASSGISIKNRTVGTPGKERTLTATIHTPVYDNTSGKLVEFGQLEPGTQYPVIQETSPYWVKVNFGGRIGFIYKPRVTLNFKSSDQFLQPLERDIPVYLNENGASVKVATLKNEQKYKIHSFSGNFIRIQYGESYGYVRKTDAYPANGSGVTNLDTGTNSPSFKSLTTDRAIEVYDNTGTTKKTIAILDPGQNYPVVNQVSSQWLQISIGGRFGYVSKQLVNTGEVKIYQNTKYDISFEEAFQKQWATGPQTDKKYKMYVSAEYITVDPANLSIGFVNDGPLNVRGGPDTSNWVIGQLPKGTKVSILGTTGSWFQVDYTVTWKNASPEDVRYYLDPRNVEKGSKYYYQFLKLSEAAGLNASEVNTKILSGKGILANKAQAFIDAAMTYNINEVYLLSHSLLETGHGTSELSKGILVTSVDGRAVTPKVVYNMFGIGAFDSCARECGAERAYQEGWFTPEAAIIGGAKYIGQSYIHHASYKQDTIYEMKWNPAVPATHQYATDIGWAYKQVAKISEIYDLLDNYEIIFDVPVYK